MPGGVWKGWGADCLRHRDADNPSLLCRRPITGTDDLTKRICMEWILSGHNIADDDPRGRSKHFEIKPREIQPVRSEEALTAKRVELFGR